jgi:Branched-chain amino acid aminotransferase/4-amino-4-deoxychorismate lyase
MSDYPPIVFLSEQFLPLDQACVSVLDRGFLFGDSVYEVIPAYGGHLFRLQAHLDRFDRSLESIRLANPMTRGRWREILETLLERNGGGDQSVYLQLTRGVAVKRDHTFPEHVRPTVFAMSTPLPGVAPEVAEKGLTAITLTDIRWAYCQIKATTLLANVLLRQQAVESGAVEAILIRNGEVTEGTASNLFIIIDGTVATPPKGPLLLPGITRDLILELTRAYGIPNQERVIREEELRHAKEIWLTSSTREIMPITVLDGRPIGNGRPGPLWARLHALFQNYKQRVRMGGE